jgi:hypothetical protein
MARTDFETMFPEAKLLGAPTYSDFRNVLHNMNEAGYFDSAAGLILGDNTIRKTLGPGGDFQDFDEVTEFLKNNIFPAGSILSLKVLDGTYNFMVKNGSLFSVENDALTIHIYGSNKNNVTINVDKEPGGAMSRIFFVGYGPLLYLSNLTINNIYQTNSNNVCVACHDANLRISNCDIIGGSTAIEVKYNAKFIGWNIHLINQNKAGRAAFYMSNNSDALIWYGLNINGGPNAKPDGIHIQGNVRMTIYYPNYTIENVNNALQVFANASYMESRYRNLTIRDANIGIHVDANGKIFRYGEPVFDNVSTPYSKPINTWLNDNSVISFDPDFFAVENGFRNNADGTAELSNSSPSDIQTAGDKSIPTLEYLLSPEFGNSLPTTDPGVPGKIWNDSGILKIS